VQHNISSLDYYSFGMLMPGRTYTTSGNGYRFGFNGKENDNEVKGQGNEVDFGARGYDSRLGRFFSVDPLTEILPFYSPYLFAINNPVLFIDEDGKVGTIYIQVLNNKKGKPVVSQKDREGILSMLVKQYKDLNINIKVKMVVSNKVLTLAQFQSRNDYNKQDSYVLIGENYESLQKENANNQSSKNGWENINFPSDDLGKSASRQFFSMIAYDYTKDNFTEYSMIYKLSYLIQHESSHPKLRFDLANDNGFDCPNLASIQEGGQNPGTIGHVFGTIMTEGKYGMSNTGYSFYQQKLLQLMHGKVDYTKSEPTCTEEPCEDAASAGRACIDVYQIEKDRTDVKKE
jgi:RHS repeat-associated protein